MFKKMQEVYLIPLESSRHNGAKVLTGTIESVGRKYITVGVGYSQYKFDIETLLDANPKGYSSRYQLSASKEEVENKFTRGIMATELKRRLDRDLEHLSLNQMQRIMEILNEKR